MLFAKILTYVFQPLLMPTFAFYTLLFHLGSASNLTETGRWIILGLIFVTTCVIPVVTVLMFKFTNVIKDLHMHERKDRYLPFVFITFYYVVVFFLIGRQDWMNDLMKTTFLAITIVVIMTNGITFKWKISAHAAGVAGWLGFILAFTQMFPSTNSLYIPMLIAVIINGLVYWARLYLNAHKPAEIWAGVLLGFCVCYGAISLFL